MSSDKKELTREEVLKKYEKWEMKEHDSIIYKDLIFDERQKYVKLKGYNLGLIVFALFIIINTLIFEIYQWCTFDVLIMLATLSGSLILQLYLVKNDATIVRTKGGRSYDTMHSWFIVSLTSCGLFFANLADYNTDNCTYVTLVGLTLLESIIVIIYDLFHKRKLKKLAMIEDSDEDDKFI